MKIYGLFFFCEKPITRISYLGHNVAVPGALATGHKIQQDRMPANFHSYARAFFSSNFPEHYDQSSRSNSMTLPPPKIRIFFFFNEVMTYLPPIDWHWDKTIAAFANIHAAMLNHVWGNLGHNTFVTCAITTLSTVKTHKNLKCKRNWKFALICTTYNHRFVHLGVSTAF